jgi:hypothetical protein
VLHLELELKDLIRHSDLRIGALRIEFLRSFSQIAWLGRSYDQFMLGSVVDVFEAEVAAIVDCPDISLAGMRQSVKAKLVQYGPPSMLRYMYDWEWLHPALKAVEEHEREVASILHADNPKRDDMKIAQLKNIRLNNRTLNLPNQTEIKQLADELRTHGDERLTNPDRSAQGLFDKAVTHVTDALKSEGDAYDIFVSLHDVPRSELSNQLTLKQYKEIARRRKLCRAACNQLGLDLDQVWQILRAAKIPSEVISETIREARKTAPRAKGSDLGDDYLSCLAPYVDAITVDKRTHEFMIQGARRNPYFYEVVGRFVKVQSYKQLPTVLKGTHETS